MDIPDQDEFAALAVLGQCLRADKPPQPTHFTEMNREKVIGRLLDGLALLLTRDSTDNTACSIHFPPDTKDEVTLVAVQTAPLSHHDKNELTEILLNISNFVTRSPPTRAFLPRNIGTGSHPDEVALARFTFPYCLARLLDKLRGVDSRVSSESGMRRIDTIITTLLQAKQIPQFKPHLVGHRFANSQMVYGSESSSEAHNSLCGSLQSFRETANAAAAAEQPSVESLYRLVLLAKQISADEVYDDLCCDLLGPDPKNALFGYLEDLGVYGVALRNIVAMRRTFWRIGDGQRPSKVAITVLDSPISRSWSPPPLSALLLRHLGSSFDALETRINESYMRETRFPLREHLEMRLLHHYISDTNLTPVIYYIGVSERPCILCGKFLGRFEQQGIRHGLIPTHYWRVKGESGIFEGRWLAPREQQLRSNGEPKGYIEDMKQELIQDIRKILDGGLDSACTV